MAPTTAGENSMTLRNVESAYGKSKEVGQGTRLSVKNNP